MKPKLFLVLHHDTKTQQPISSPLVTRREMCPASPALVRMTFEGSPALSRRYVSPVLPTPPPHRLSKSGFYPLPHILPTTTIWSTKIG